MEIVSLNAKSYQVAIQKAKQVLINDGLVVFPSDTVYGLAANALSEKAVNKLYEFKKRPLNQSVSISIKNLSEAKKYVEINSSNKKLLETFLPGPYTIVLDSCKQTVRQLEAPNQTLAIRWSAFSFMQDLNKALAFPYTATSANIHNKGPHHSISSLLNTLSEKKKKLLDLVIDMGELPHLSPSTIINLTEDKIKIIRQGDYSFKLIKQVVTNNEDNTKKLAQELIQQLYRKNPDNKPVILILDGDLGTGKTIFTKGIAQNFGIDNIVSPTYVIYYEYKSVNKNVNFLYHFDLYRLESDQELLSLEIEKLIKPKNLLVFEWGQKLGSIFKLIKNKSALIVLVKIHEISSFKREFKIYQLK